MHDDMPKKLEALMAALREYPARRDAAMAAVRRTDAYLDLLAGRTLTLRNPVSGLLLDTLDADGFRYTYRVLSVRGPKGRTADLVEVGATPKPGVSRVAALNRAVAALAG